MRKVLIVIVAMLAMGAVAQQAAAQNRVQLGVRAGIGSQSMDMDFSGVRDAKARLGWNLAAVSRIRLIALGDCVLGTGLYLQPEIVYSQNSVKMDYARGDEVSHEKIRMKTIDVPLLVSLKVSIARVQAGPVFNLMNNFDSKDSRLELHPLRPAVGYALGASVDLLGLTFDARYHGEFKKMSFEGNWADFKSRFSSWSVGVGIMF